MLIRRVVEERQADRGAWLRTSRTTSSARASRAVRPYEHRRPGVRRATLEATARVRRYDTIDVERRELTVAERARPRGRFVWPPSPNGHHCHGRDIPCVARAEDCDGGRWKNLGGPEAKRDWNVGGRAAVSESDVGGWRFRLPRAPHYADSNRGELGQIRLVVERTDARLKVSLGVDNPETAASAEMQRSLVNSRCARRVSPSHR